MWSINQAILNNKNELNTLNSLKRGIYAKNDISANHKITIDDVFLHFHRKRVNFMQMIFLNIIS